MIVRGAFSKLFRPGLMRDFIKAGLVPTLWPNIFRRRSRRDVKYGSSWIPRWRPKLQDIPHAEDEWPPKPDNLNVKWW